MYFSYLRGTVAEIEQSRAVIDCNGVGYECSVSAYTISQLKIGEEAKLFTFCSIREDAFEIFGFKSKEEKNCFEMLTGVNGVGPKAALSILSACNPSAFKLAVLSGDEKAITAAQGVGKKLAQRILLELKDKLSLNGDTSEVQGIAAGISVASSHQNDAVAALNALGYSQSEIAQALKGLKTEGMTTEDIVRAALRAMVMKA